MSNVRIENDETNKQRMFIGKDISKFTKYEPFIQDQHIPWLLRYLQMLIQTILLLSSWYPSSISVDSSESVSESESDSESGEFWS